MFLEPRNSSNYIQQQQQQFDFKADLWPKKLQKASSQSDSARNWLVTGVNASKKKMLNDFIINAIQWDSSQQYYNILLPK